MNLRDQKFFKVAKSIAELSTFHQEKLGAIIVLRNEIIATGYNRNKSSPMQAFWANKAGRPEAIYTHAEMSALNKVASAQFAMTNADIMKVFVYRQFADGTPAMARPCEICSMALKHLGIKRWYYTTDDGFAYEEIE
jgi:deoxycytidylate deaminase